MKIEIIPYEPIHGYRILEKNTIEANIRLGRLPGWEKMVEDFGNYGPAFTIFIEEEPITCGGIILLPCQKGEAWLISSKTVLNIKLFLYKSIKNYLSSMTKENKLRRVQALCDPSFKKGISLLKHLGFENETPNGMKKFGPNGETMFMFAKIFGE